MPSTPPSPAPAFDIPNEIQVKWAAEGGVTGPLGQPTSAAVVASASLCYQSFEGGAIAAWYDIYNPGWFAYAVLKNVGVTGPRWDALGGVAVSLPSSDEESVPSGTYQRFRNISGVGNRLEHLIIAPKATPAFDVGFGATPDQTATMIVFTRSMFPDDAHFGRLPLFTAVGVPDRPAACGLTGGACELFFGAGTWRDLSVPTVGLVAYYPASPIGVAYQARGAETGLLGFPTRTITCQTADCRAAFENGDLSLYQGAAHVVEEPYRSSDRYGLATSDAVCGIAGGRCRQDFTDGSVYKLATGSTALVGGAIKDKWLALGGEQSFLGFPVADAVQTARGAQQQFERGYLAEGPHPTGSPTPAYVIKGGILGEYLKTGANALGAPLDAEVCTAPFGGCYQWFEMGIIWWSSSAGAYSVLNSDFRWPYQNRNWAWGPFGYPTTNLQCTAPNGGCYQNFQGGTLWATASIRGISGLPAVSTHGAIGGKYASAGYAWGPLGYPGNEEDCPVETICHQDFAGGQIWWTPSTGAHVLKGAIGDTWNHFGQLGFPLEDEQCTGPGGGCYQWFQAGVYWWSAQAGTHSVKGGIKAAYESMGWAWGGLGYPISNEYLPAGTSGGVSVWRQDFQGGSIIWTYPGYVQVIWH